MNTLITIKYLYRGTEISKQFSNYFEIGEKYEIQSPIIKGYYCDKRYVTGRTGINDICIIVNYYKE